MRVLALLCITLSAMAASSQIPLPFRFTLKPGCVLPFAEIAPAKDAFVACDHAGRMDGVPVPDLAERLRSGAKNNLCAAADPIPLEAETLSALPQTSASMLARTRAGLASVMRVSGRWLGEGSVVQFVGYITRAAVDHCRTPNAGHRPGEAANCHVLGGMRTADIRLTMMPPGAARDASECESVTAKIIPHFRPNSWSEIDLKTPKVSVRVTGQLFYDDLDPPCGRDASGRWRDRGMWARRTNWEIHPVYTIDVCQSRDASQCEVSRREVWVPYHRWIARADARVVHATGRAERTRCEAAAARWSSQSRLGPRGRADAIE